MVRTVGPVCVSRLRRDEAGAASSEHAGALVVAVILILALVGSMTPIGRTVVAGVSNEICRVFGLGCTSIEAAPTVDTRRPTECTVTSREESGSYYVNLGIIKIGESSSMSVKEEQYYDPKTGAVGTRYHVTANDGGLLGVEGSFGPEARINGSGIGREASAGVTGSYSAGDTWIFESKPEMDAFVQQLNAYRIQQQNLTASGVAGMGISGYPAYLALTDGFVDPPRAPDQRSTTIKVDGKVNANWNARVGTDNPVTGQESVNTGVGTYVEGQLGQSMTTKRDHRPGHKGEFTETVSYSGSFAGGANAVFSGVGGTGSYVGETTYGYKPGPNGDPVLSSVTFTQTTSGSGLTWKTGNGPVDRVGALTGSGSGETATQQAVTTETTLEVTDANRAIVEQWRANSTRIGPSEKPVFLLPSNVLDPSEPPTNGDPMAQLLYEEATNTRTTYNVASDKDELSAAYGVGPKIGGGLSYGNENQNLVDSTYLASPSRPGAMRQQRDNLVCK